MAGRRAAPALRVGYDRARRRGLPFARSAARPRLALVLCAVGGILSCRDDVELFRPQDRPRPRGETVRLTYNSGDDRSPAWSLDGDTLYYVAEGFDELGSPDGLLLQVPRRGGSASRLLGAVQAQESGDQHRLASPAPAPAPAVASATGPAGGRIAFVEIAGVWRHHPCSLENTSLSCEPPRSEEEARQPPLTEIVVHVRSREATGPLSSDPALELETPGLVEDLETGITAIVHDHPFQQLFARQRIFALRASWAPDGERLAVSDGLSLYVWRVGEGSATPVPEGDYGAWAAWSPVGDEIAFARLAPADSSGSQCLYTGFFGEVVCRQVRTEYVPAPPELWIVRVDGAEARVLGEGEEPAWSPDGSWLFFRRGDTIWRAAPDGSQMTKIAGTEGGREPAVSPDGRLLAFTRLSGAGDYDVWVIGLED